MNTNGLTRLYDRLTVWERIPLLVSANAREDKPEYQRLFDASPVRTWRFPEHMLAEQALHVLALMFVSEQLEAAGAYFFSVWRFDDSDDPQQSDWLAAAHANAYVFTANAAAWNRFCADLDVAPAALTHLNYRGWLLPFCEAHMPADAPTREAMRGLLREAGADCSDILTADTLWTSWRKRFQTMTGHTPPGEKGRL